MWLTPPSGNAVFDEEVALQCDWGRLILNWPMPKDQPWALVTFCVETAEGVPAIVQRLKHDKANMVGAMHNFEEPSRKCKPFFINWDDPSIRPDKIPASHKVEPKGIEYIKFTGSAQDEKALHEWIGTQSLPLKFSTEMYSKLYPETSSDGVLRLGNLVPDFTCNSTQGKIHWYEWIEGSWAILFSHPADFTPVCTTEIGKLALKYDELEKLNCKVATLSADAVESHTKWLDDVVAHCENKLEVKFPILGDEDREISTKYGMLDPNNKDSKDLPLTIRQGLHQHCCSLHRAAAVFIIGPDKKLKLSLNYPASVGRNMDEIVRCVKALQLSAKMSVATPANWPNNHESIDKKGWAFLLPTVSEEDAKKHFPDHHSCKVPSGVDYLRLTKVDH
eukprot:jgi/Astpho2/3453/Aster-07051